MHRVKKAIMRCLYRHKHLFKIGLLQLSFSKKDGGCYASI